MSEPPDFDPARDRALDATSLRGLAHPVRVQMLGLLRTEGPATATRLAARLGLNSGATSYHLRQLAAHGFVVEATDLGTGRDRWWRAAHRSTWYDMRAATDDPDAGDAYLRSVARIYADTLLRAVDERATLPQEWQDVSTMSDFVLQLTPAEADRLSAQILEVLRPYRRADPEAPAPEGTAPTTFQFGLFPLPGALGGAGPDPDPAEEA
ncbi:DNA-binding transcriptional regulator, ArsR family [Actinopolymorpha cephalotaxi]|uniref:DNA-binding transcriptional ArsR family regulator n=1 Tax=Actinopolymorpha cephalotaxi TaxID=504797 RepID=A0A1I3AFT4_9ACTN|nr:winged helix-turn-helix domain-containing protein [Actinopolymorpha cephalotaxi]NYH82099.1 DNA-binding transcriptional ArsR family regulator [Actinopolymorpha cephalotaxi]SFH48559.1 DNA-binding transcriptional regulator, ArsR family [Actinopolymorpha cephalotaxi]